MNITSEDEALIELYTNGKTSDKRYRSLPPQVIKGFKKAVDYMKAARRIEDLFSPWKDLTMKPWKVKEEGKSQYVAMVLGGWYSDVLSLMKASLLQILNY